jgi:hypothetical protein
VIVAFVHAQSQRYTGFGAGIFQKLRLELAFQELVCRALIDKQFFQSRAILKQGTSIVSSPTLLVSAEISTQRFFASRAVYRRADRREGRH